MSAVKAFGDIGQTAWLRQIRDRFIAGHNSCELRRHLDSVPPETPIQDIVDQCRVWESHADTDVRRASKPGPDTVFPAYAVSDPDGRVDDLWVAAVATPQSTPDQEVFHRRLLASAAATLAPTPKPEPPAVDQLLQRLMSVTQARQPAPAAATRSAGLETLLQNLLSGSLTPVRQSRPGPIRRDWNTVVCFSCGNPGHSANRCPTLDDSFPFMLPGWSAEKVAGGYAMISPRAAAERRRVENGD